MSLMDIEPPIPINMRWTRLGIRRWVFYNNYKNDRELDLKRAWGDLNSRPLAPEASALSAELQAHSTL